MRIFSPPVGLPMHNLDSLRRSQSFIYRKKHFLRTNSVIKRVFHCIKLTLTKDWAIHVSFSLYFSSIIKKQTFRSCYLKCKVSVFYQSIVVCRVNTNTVFLLGFSLRIDIIFSIVLAKRIF